MRREDVNTKGIAVAALTLSVLAAVIHVSLIWFHGYLAKQRSHPGPAAALVTPLEIDSGEPLKELRKSETLKLSLYGWVNREQGIVRIPIERAIEIRSGQTNPSEAKHD
jgi:hypothetical protein